MNCAWKNLSPESLNYHDTEWGTPVHSGQKLFEFLALEMMQCGLSWDLIVRKREIMRTCFSNFDPKAIANYAESDVARILRTPGMIKNERKIRAVIHNAKIFNNLCSAHGTFDNFLWRYTNGKTFVYARQPNTAMPSHNSLSEKLSKDLKAHGFKFFGPVVAYSYLQACGLINDHDPDCPRFTELITTYPTAPTVAQSSPQ